MKVVGMIGPRGRPGFLHPHAHGVINLIEPRRFRVDDKATRVVDKPGEELVLTGPVFEDIRKAIEDGASMFIEPIGHESGAPTELEADLRRAVAEIERLQELAAVRARDSAGAEARAGELQGRLDQANVSLERAQRDLVAKDATIADLRATVAKLDARKKAAAEKAPA